MKPDEERARKLGLLVKDSKRQSRALNPIPPCKTMCNRKKYKRTNKINMEE